MTAIHCEDLELHRPGRGGFRLGPLALHLPSQRRIALVGPSGCGKTTLLRLLAGLEVPALGRIRFGEQLATDGPRLLLPPQQRGIGFVFQDGALWPHLDALGHLRFAAPQLDAAGAEQLLGRVGLAGKGRRRPGELSGGERQRLALARALAGQPAVLLLDEPLHSVDVHLRAELALLIRDLAEAAGITLVLVTHDRQEALAIADHVAVLRDGQLVEQGEASELLARPRTAFTAAFLAGAACLPAVREGVAVTTPFGTFPAPGAGELQLAILPGDAIVAATGPVLGRVLQVAPTPAGRLAAVRVADATVQVLVPAEVGNGATIHLALAGAPRLLPTTHA